jgi:hypothetical protein
MNTQKQLLDNYTKVLLENRDKIDSVSSDTALYSFPEDSVNIVKYIDRLRVFAMDLRPVDSPLKINFAHSQDLQNRTDLMIYELKSIHEDVELLRKEYATLRSDMISNIDKCFRKEGIKIPLPQQEIIIRNNMEPGKGF